MNPKTALILLASLLTAALAASLLAWKRQAPSPAAAGPEEPLSAASSAAESAPRRARKLFWFVPDGLRADPETFTVFRWAAEGKLPNIRALMERGAHGYCRPAFPCHTPTNFATLFTGSYPEVHGINDGPMHLEGQPLDRVSVGGFQSGAKLVEPIWVTLERSPDLDVVLLSVPGSTPPELRRGITIRGRWGGWGADFPAVTFWDPGARPASAGRGHGDRLFHFGPRLSEIVARRPAAGWRLPLASRSPPLEAELSAWGARVHALITDEFDGTGDAAAGYDRIRFSFDKAEAIASLRQGDWSEWLPITLVWKVPGQDSERPVETRFRIKAIRVAPDGGFRVRFLFDALNRHLAAPDGAAEELLAGIGPMVDFVDNFPPQLIHVPEDKAAFLEEAAMSIEWHRQAADFLLRRHRPDVFIHDIYTPNQMLTSRWWLGHLDPKSRRYGEVAGDERRQLWDEVLEMYRGIDAILGALLAHADDETLVVLSSDHGAVPIDRSVRLNNLFAREGLLKFAIDEASGEARIDWASTRAVYLQMSHVYVHPGGLAGPWKRASGGEYDALRGRVRRLLEGLADESGIHPAAEVLGWEDARQRLRLRPERAGDLVIANRAGYGWSEELTADLEVFATPLHSGYKQAILAEDAPGLWTPFVLAGPGVRRGASLGESPIEMVDQYPTLLALLGIEVPEFVQGRPVDAVFDLSRASAAVPEASR
jgi:predicted AlkP superfamily phosphohydrolase/phosphomutase